MSRSPTPTVDGRDADAAARPVRISAVIPTFNRGRLVGRAVESALSQTRPPDELIVVDDGSTDDTAARVAEIGGDVRYLRQDNEGSSAARNTGVAAARFPWIAFLDSDDTWRPRHLEHIERAIVATAGVAALYFGDTLGSSAEGGRPYWELSGLSIAGPHELRIDASDWVMRGVQPMMLQASVIRRDDYLALGGLVTSLVLRHDTHLFFRLGLGGAACAVTGGGAVMTADDDTGRLSERNNGATSQYWRDTVLMYDDLLRTRMLPRTHRNELRARLAVAHLRLGRMALRQRRARQGLAGVARAAATSPGTLVRRGLRRAVAGRAPS